MADMTGSNPDSSRERSRQGKWRILSRWSASRSASQSTTLSSDILKISDREDDESRGPAVPRPRSPRRESAKRKLQTRPSSGTLARDSSGDKPAEPSPVPSQADSTGPSGRQSSFWRTSYQPDEGSSVHRGPAGSPGASGRQSFWSRGEDSSGLHRAPPAFSPRLRVSGARQPDASLQHPAGSQPTRSAASTPRRGEPASEPRAKRATRSTSGKNDASRAKPVAEVDRATQGRTSSSISRPSKQRKQGTAAKRPVGYKVLKEILRLRASTRKLIPRQPFERVVREIVRRHTTDGHDLRIARAAFEALQEASEATVVAVLEGAGVNAHRAGRATTTTRDMATVLADIRNYGMLHSSLCA
ncbi:histone H3.v1-like [Dermacentor albipictus]|uniref:histone H3.v1-like n=1 Tax=Dermacentor albipictus TaxID=60249 RepID=UPI0038FC5D19